MASRKALRQQHKAERRANSSPLDRHAPDPEAFDDLADRTTFVLSPEKFDEFTDMLDAPAEPCPKLVALFARPSRFEE